MVKKSNEAENEPNELKWVWRPENVDDTALHGKGRFSANRIVDQKVADDVSDYLWYMTRYVYIYFLDYYFCYIHSN